MSKEIKYISVLRTWIGVQSLIVFGNSVQCFVDFKYMASKLYTNVPKDVNPLTGRLFGLWALICAILRIFCAIDIYNKTIYLLTAISFVLSLGHFTSEVFVYKSAELNIGVTVQVVLSGISLMAMFTGYWYLDRRSNTIDENKEFQKLLKKKKS